jgi:glycerophosphoryl diester phosphodiesterase
MKIMGHRGARDSGPENTMRSFRAALSAGLLALEFDIHQSIDGVWVVHHDYTLDRTTTSKGYIAMKSWSELSHVLTCEGDHLPRLEEVLDLTLSAGAEVQVEIKSHGDFAGLGAILSRFPIEKMKVISFNHRWLRDIKVLYPHLNTACLFYGLPVNPVEIVAAAMANGISLNVSWIDAQLVLECHAAGLSVTVWNANDEETFLKMVYFGVDYIATDVPLKALHWKEVASKSLLK